MSTRDLVRRFQSWRRSGTPLALATVIETTGSTYSKAGHRILIAAGGDYQGLVSGGCLENDLGLHARQVIESGAAKIVSYDLRQESDELFGLGVGCDGALRILLQRLHPDQGYAPFADLAALLEGHAPGVCAVVASEGPYLGATVILSGDHVRCHGLEPDAARALEQQGRAHIALPRRVTVTAPREPLTVLFASLAPIPRLLLLGAGPDAVPVVALGEALGWRITVMDHRPAYLERPGLGAAAERLCTPAGTVPAAAPLAHFDAVLVMNHHLATDRRWLATLAGSNVPYIGLLGPRGRRERLLEALGPDAARLADRLHGPAGLGIGADSPESIALSIWAEIEMVRRGIVAGGEVAAEAAPAGVWEA